MSQLIDKRCPLCGSYIKLHTGDVHSCISCPFKCFEDDFDRVCKAMNAQAELATLNDAAAHSYNSGYHAGHHYTVEGGYVDIHSSDMDTYHAEEVAELLAALVGEE